VNPLPALFVVVKIISAPKTNSFATVVVAEPLLGLELFPTADAVASKVETPRYSKMRTSGYDAAAVNVTVTVFEPLTMLLA